MTRKDWSPVKSNLFTIHFIRLKDRFVTKTLVWDINRTTNRYTFYLFILETRMTMNNDTSFNPAALLSQRYFPCQTSLSYTCPLIKTHLETWSMHMAQEISFVNQVSLKPLPQFSCVYPCSWMLNPFSEMMIITGHRSNMAADSIYLWGTVNYVTDPEICQADSACKALIDNVAGTPTHKRLSVFVLYSCGINRLLSLIRLTHCPEHK